MIASPAPTGRNCVCRVDYYITHACVLSLLRISPQIIERMNECSFIEHATENRWRCKVLICSLQ